MTEELRSRIEILELNDTQDKGTFALTPLDRGYGLTIGNSLRRVLLASLEGACVTRVKFQNVQHEFSTIEGVLQDVPEIILNLKGLACKMHGDDPIMMHFDFKGPMEVRAGDLNQDANLTIVNTDHLIMTLNEDAEFHMELEISKGKGYHMVETAESNETQPSPLADDEETQEEESIIVGFIPLDASYSPIEAVNFDVSNTRVGKQTDFDRLVINVETNGTIKAQEALAQAATILIEHFNQFVELPNLELVSLVDSKKTTAEDEKVLETPIDTINLSLRSFNCLKRAGIDTVGDITRRTYNEMFKIKNFGKKSIKEVEDKLAEMGLTFSEESEEPESTEA